MRISINFVLKTQKENKRGKCPIYMRVYVRRKTRYLSTSIKIKPKDWNPEKEVIRRPLNVLVVDTNILAQFWHPSESTDLCDNLY